MTERSNVPGYVSPEEVAMREAAAMNESRARERNERARLSQEILGKIELARTSMTPRNCVVEKWEPKLFSWAGRVVESYPAWYIGGFTIGGSSGEYNSPGWSSYFALTDSGKLLHSIKPLDKERNAFIIGSESVVGTSEKKESRSLGSRMKRLPKNIEYLSELNSLYGWHEVIEGCPHQDS